MQPDIIDTSSGVETAGLKDPDKIISFCENARR
jgi:phosphoribosylanthranilate isomerase